MITKSLIRKQRTEAVFDKNKINNKLTIKTLKSIQSNHHFDKAFDMSFYEL